MFHPRKKSGRKNALPLIHLSLVSAAFSRELKLGRILEHHLMVRAPGGNHRVAILVRIGMNVDQDRTFVLQAMKKIQLLLTQLWSTQSADPVSIGELHEIRQLAQN